MDYTEQIENDEIFVLCINTVEDGFGVYCIEGREYEIIEYLEDEDCFVIEGEDECEVQIKVDDADFEITI